MPPSRDVNEALWPVLVRVLNNFDSCAIADDKFCHRLSCMHHHNQLLRKQIDNKCLQRLLLSAVSAFLSRSLAGATSQQS